MMAASPNEANLHRLLKMGIGDLQVMLFGNWYAVAHPLSDDVSQKSLCHLRLTCASKRFVAIVRDQHVR